MAFDPRIGTAAARLWRLRWWALGPVGWAVLAWAYPIDWRLPVYAGF